MKIGYQKGKGYYVGWCCPMTGTVVYTWFPTLEAAQEFFHTR